MTEKIGKDVIKQKRRLKEKLEDANQIQIQVKALEELSKRKMNSQELQNFVEGLGGVYYLILPRLKESGLLETERDGWTNVYSLKRGEQNEG
jgi:DNA-binding PadR family transcriptional regulator